MGLSSIPKKIKRMMPLNKSIQMKIILVLKNLNLFFSKIILLHLSIVQTVQGISMQFHLSINRSLKKIRKIKQIRFICRWTMTIFSIMAEGLETGFLMKIFKEVLLMNNY